MDSSTRSKTAKWTVLALLVGVFAAASPADASIVELHIPATIGAFSGADGNFSINSTPLGNSVLEVDGVVQQTFVNSTFALNTNGLDYNFVDANNVNYTSSGGFGTFSFGPLVGTPYLVGQLLDYQASITAANVVEASGTILVQAGSLIPTFGVDGELTQVQVAFGGAAPAAFAAAGQSAGFSFFTSTTITATNPPSDAIIPEPASALVWFTVAGLSLVALRARRKAKA